MVTKNFFQKCTVCALIMLMCLPCADIAAQSYRDLHNAARLIRQQRERSKRNQQLLEGLFSKKQKKKKNDKKEKDIPEEKKDTVVLENANISSLKKSREASGEQSDAKQARETGKDVQLLVTGDGKTKDDAVQSALRSAIEQAFGTFVSSNTQILNDELVRDEIATVSSGNIKKYEILSENEHAGGWTVNIKTTVSINSLIEFAKSKGNEAELAGAVYLMNLKMARLNIANEEKAIAHLFSQLKAMMPYIFDYEIIVDEPKEAKVLINRKGESPFYYVYPNHYRCNIKIIVKANNNIVAFNNLFVNTLKALRTSPEEMAMRDKLGGFPDTKTRYGLRCTNDYWRVYRQMIRHMMLGFKIVDNFGEYKLQEMLVKEENSSWSKNEIPQIYPCKLLDKGNPNILYSGFILNGCYCWLSNRDERLTVDKQVFSLKDIKIPNTEKYKGWDFPDNRWYSNTKNGYLETYNIIPVFFPTQNIFTITGYMIYEENELQKLTNISITPTNEMLQKSEPAL